MVSDLCGMDLPQEVVTPGPRLVLLFNSGSVPAAGFKAKFFFETGTYVSFIRCNAFRLPNIVTKK